MIKRFSQYFLMVMVIFSLFAPSVIPLMAEDTEQIALIDLTEEENKKENKKESKKELEEKDVFFEGLGGLENSFRSMQLSKAIHYLEGYYQFHPEIHSPPPEHS